jgi:hypothetical protein
MKYWIMRKELDGTQWLISRHESEETARKLIEWYGFSRCEVVEMGEVEDDTQD